MAELIGSLREVARLKKDAAALRSDIATLEERDNEAAAPADFVELVAAFDNIREHAASDWMLSTVEKLRRIDEVHGMTTKALKSLQRVVDVHTASAQRIAVKTSPSVQKDIADKRKRLDEIEARLAVANEDLKNLMHAAGAEDAWEMVFAR